MRGKFLACTLRWTHRRAGIQGNRNRNLERTRRGRQGCAEETSLGVDKMAHIVEIGCAVKPAVGQAAQEDGEDD